MWLLLQIAGLATLGIFFLFIAFSQKIQWYWGRRGKDWPLTLLQQRIGGLMWGVVLILLSSVTAASVFWPRNINQTRWHYLSDFLFLAGAGSTWLLALLDPRIIRQVRESRKKRFVIVTNWGFAFLLIFIAIATLWEFAKA